MESDSFERKGGEDTRKTSDLDAKGSITAKSEESRIRKPKKKSKHPKKSYAPVPSTDKNAKPATIDEDAKNNDENTPRSISEVVVQVRRRKDAWPSKKKNFIITSLELANWQLALKYVITDTKKHKRAFLIGFVTVFLVVWFTSLLENSISKSPIVFLKLSEDQVGEYDLVMTPMLTNDVRTFWLNYTEIDAHLEGADLVKGSVPRWVLLGRIENAADTSKNTSTAILVVDSEKEEKIGLGRGWTFAAPGEDEAHVSSSVLKTIGVHANAGESVNLVFDIPNLLATSGALEGQALDEFVQQLLAQNVNASQFNGTIAQFLDSVQPQLEEAGVNATAILRQLFGGNLPNLNVTFVQFVEFLIERAVSTLVIQREYIVMESIESPEGKFPKALGNVVLIESKYVHDLVDQFITQLRENVIPDPSVLEPWILVFPDQATRDQIRMAIDILKNISTTLENFQKTFDINHYALTVISMYTNRFETYTKDLKEMNADLIVFTNQVADAIGYDYPATFTLPLQVALQPLYFIRLFLDQIFTFVAVVLIVLGGLLIYSLLLSNVEEKTYEYGMLRGLGMKQYVLIELLITQSLSFSLPGILVGLFVSFLTFIPVAVFISNFALSPMDVSMTAWAAGLAIILGLTMPLIAIVAPIRRALSRTLRDALDIYHQIQSETTVKIIKLEKLGLSPWQLSASVMMIIMGFVVYYVIPYSFTFNDLPLFFTILILILLGMLFGLSLIGTTIQPFAERLAISLLMWGEDRRTLSQLVRKNLSAHSRRNLKTAVMFTTSLAFIIFAGSSFSLQGHTISETVQLATGADLLVLAPFSEASPLNEKGLRQYLDEEMARPNSLVKGYTFGTYDITLTSFVQWATISNLAGFPTFDILLYGVEENYLAETYDRFYRPSEVDDKFKYRKTSSGKDDVVYSLYADAGKATLPQEKGGIVIPPDISSSVTAHTNQSGQTTPQKMRDAYVNYVDVLVSESLRYSGSIDTKTPLKLNIGFYLDRVNTSELIYLCKSRAMIRSFPGFFFSSYRQTAPFSPVIVTMDSYYRIMKDIYYAKARDVPILESPPKLDLHVRLKDNPTKAERESVINGLRNFIEDDLTQVIDTADLIDSTKVALNLLTLFFNLVSVVAVILCFFVLWLSFTANVRENAWEFGVLRAVGLNVNKVIRMYIYEALCLITASVLIGAIVGMLVSITLTLQFNLFTELAFTFDFPYYLFFSVFAMSILVAVFGSYLPANVIKKKDIAIALKNM